MGLNKSEVMKPMGGGMSTSRLELKGANRLAQGVKEEEKESEKGGKKDERKSSFSPTLFMRRYLPFIK